MRSGVSRARSRRGVVGVRAASVLTSAAGGAGGEGGEGALRDAEVPTRDDVEAGHEDLASGAGRRAVAEVADDVRSQIPAHSVDGARTPSQQALDSKGHEQKALSFELKAPRERALALHASQQRSPNGAIVAASPARAAGEDENFAPGERHGSYAYGSLYFEETRLRSRYMLCRGEPGACPPEEVMANLCDEFGLPNPQMIFFGLGANGRWNTGFATLDVFASKLINQVRSSGPFRSEARLGSVAVWKSKFYFAFAESPRRPPRDRRDACSMAWRTTR